MLARLAAAAGASHKVETDRVIANGRALETHWERGLARDAIRSAKWDYVVLQEQSTLPLKNPARMHEYVTLFDEMIRRSGAKTVLYMTSFTSPLPSASPNRREKMSGQRETAQVGGLELRARRALAAASTPDPLRRWVAPGSCGATGMRISDSLGMSPCPCHPERYVRFIACRGCQFFIDSPKPRRYFSNAVATNHPNWPVPRHQRWMS